MSARNIDKFAELGRLLIENHDNRDDLSSDETLKLLQTAREPGNDDRIINAITAAFYMGYAAGYRRAGSRRVTTVGEYMKEQQAKAAAENSYSN